MTLFVWPLSNMDQHIASSMYLLQTLKPLLRLAKLDFDVVFVFFLCFFCQREGAMKKKGIADSC